jgi:DNA-binding response OmpR family regulator
MSKSPKILVVDDELRNLAIVEELLEGYDVEVALTGEEALEKSKRMRPDLILLDVMMPGMDGYEVCRRIKATGETRTSKVIFVSGKAMIEERLVGYAAGGDDYIAKPFDHAELLAKIRVYLRLKVAEDEARQKSDSLRIVAMGAESPLRLLMTAAKDMVRASADLPQEVGKRLEQIVIHGALVAEYLKRGLAEANRSQLTSSKATAPARSNDPSLEARAEPS